MERSIQTGPGEARRGDERWTVASEGDAADRMEVRLLYAAATPTRTSSGARVYSARNPDFHRIYRVGQDGDFLRSGPAGADWIEEFTFAASGPQLGAAFGGTERLVAVLSVPSDVRRVFLP